MATEIGKWEKKVHQLLSRFPKWVAYWPDYLKDDYIRNRNRFEEMKPLSLETFRQFEECDFPIRYNKDVEI